MDNDWMAAAAAAGFEFERQLCVQARLKGFLAHRVRNSTKPYDAIIAGRRVQCKNRMTYSSDIQLNKARRYSSQEFDVLALRLGERLCLIDVSSIAAVGGVLPWSLRREWCLRFENNWGVFRSEGLATATATATGQILLFEDDQ